MPSEADGEELELPEGAAYAGRAGPGCTWKATAQAEEAATEKTASFILATGKEVRHNPMWQEGGDVIRIREFRLANYRENPVFLAEHDASKVIGRGSAKIVAISTDEHQLHMGVEWDLADDNPLAHLVAGQHARKMRNAVSVGFMPGKGSVPRTKLAADDPFHMDPEKTSSWRAGMMFRHPELYEGSSVGIPKDPGAMQLRQWAMEAETDEERIARIVDEILTRRSAELVLSAFKASPELRTAIVAATLAELPPLSSPNPKPEVQSSDWWSDFQ